MKQLFDGYYAGKRVLVTGHTGFKGSWLTQWLLLLGAEGTGYSIGVPTQPSLYESLGLSRQIQDVRGDVRRFQDVQTAMDKAAPEVVIHMAAQALVLPSYADPLTTFETNVMGTANVLRGDMSVVGPRPERPELAQKILKGIPDWGLRLLVRPGITGVAQVQGRYTTAPEDKLTMDLAYIRARSLFNYDLTIILRTFKMFFLPDRRR